VRLAQYFDKPEYLFRPGQVIRRLFSQRGPPDVRKIEIDLSWGLTITCNPNDDIGRSIASYGVYDLVVTEVIHRLLKSGDVGVDVGANIGHMTGAMAKCSGPKGRVVSFEPCTQVRKILSANVERWGKDRRLSRIELRSAAVSRNKGKAALTVGPDFESNEGTASLEATDGWTQAEVVPTVTLDDEWADGPPINLLKVDVEGHEMAVFEGSQVLLSSRRIRNIVFEEHRPWPSPAQSLLLDHGYSIFRLSRTISRLKLTEAAIGYSYKPGVLPNFVATADASRLKIALGTSGWCSLRKPVFHL
jgi:FkbM family methyltransferase